MQTDLANSDQKLQDTIKEGMVKQNNLEKEKNDLENQSKEHFKQIEKLTANYVNNINSMYLCIFIGYSIIY